VSEEIYFKGEHIRGFQEYLNDFFIVTIDDDQSIYFLDRGSKNIVGRI
jgi:hypothetical protein